MQLLDPARMRLKDYTSLRLGASFVTRRELTFHLSPSSPGKIVGCLVGVEAPAITLARLSPEAREVAQAWLTVPFDDHDPRPVLGLLLQKRAKAGGSRQFVRGIFNCLTGEGVFESCEDPTGSELTEVGDDELPEQPELADVH